MTVIKWAPVSTAAELSAALNKTYDSDITIKLLNDIDLAGVEWGSHILSLGSNAHLIIDGNNKTISGLNTTETVESNGFSSNGLVASVARYIGSNGTLTFKNLTVKNATITNNVGWNSAAGVFVGDVSSIMLNFENCKVVNAYVTSEAYAAGFIGYFTNHEADTNQVNISNCIVTGSTFTGKDATGALVALNNSATTINGATVTGNTINGGNGYSAAALVGTAQNNVVATGVVVSGNTYTVSEGNTSSNIVNADYGCMFKGNGKTYSVNGTAL